MNNKTDVAKSLSNQVIAQQSIVSKAFGRVKVNEQTLNKINIPDEYLKTTKGLATKPAINKPNTQERKDNIKTAKQRAQAPQPPARKDAHPPQQNIPQKFNQPPANLPPAPLPRDNAATKAILDKRNRELASAAAKAAMPAPIAPMAQAKESLEKPKGRREKFADKVKQTFKNRNNKGRG